VTAGNTFYQLDEAFCSVQGSQCIWALRQQQIFPRRAAENSASTACKQPPPPSSWAQIWMEWVQSYTKETPSHRDCNKKATVKIFTADRVSSL